MAVEASATRRLFYPGAGGHGLTFPDIAAIVDLVAGDDPDIGVEMLGHGVARPMFGRDLFHPLHPDGIVHMAKAVDMLGRGGELGGVCGGHVLGSIDAPRARPSPPHPSHGREGRCPCYCATPSCHRMK